MREGWIKSTLGEVCDLVKRGIAPKYTDTSGVCVLNQKCIRNHEINLEQARRHNIEDKPVNPERYIRFGDVLVNSTGTGTLGRVAQVRKEPNELITVDTHVTIVRPKSGHFYPAFFGYMMIKIEDEIAESGEGASGQTELPRTKLANDFKVSYPASREEQKRIVAILDEAFAGIDTAIANTEKNLANARELFESYLNNVFTNQGKGWKKTKLRDICNIKHGFAFKSEFFVEDSDYVVLTPGSFYESGGFRDQGKKTKYYQGEIPDGYLMGKGEFVVAMTEQAAGLLGSSLIVPEAGKYLHNQRLGLVKPFAGVQWHNDFFFHQFNTRGFRDAVQLSASGVKVRHTSPTKLSEIDICFPPTIDKQKDIADRLNEIQEETRKLESIYRKKLNSLKELKQSLLQKAFSGELTSKPDKLIDEAVA